MVDSVGSPNVLLMFGSEGILADFVKLAKPQKSTDTIYLAVGLRDPDYFYRLLLQSRKRSFNTTNIYSTSAVCISRCRSSLHRKTFAYSILILRMQLPPLSSSDSQIVSDYKAQLQSYYGTQPSAAGIEGYLAGLLIGEVCSGTGPVDK